LKKLLLTGVCLFFFVIGYFVGSKREPDFSIKQEIIYLSKYVNLLDDYRIGSSKNLEQAIEMEVIESVYTIGLLLSENEKLLDSSDKAMLTVVFKIVPVLGHPDSLKEMPFMPNERHDSLVTEINRVRNVVISP